ncbi:MAG TPA: hypothetical protein VFJ16_00235 [Longimicrobium sp.]|nr:hypothetical protein [Longimicrobium sp.]
MAALKDHTAEDLDRFQIALESEIERTTLRAVVRKVGTSPTGLTKFLNGGQPYGSTVARLRKWYYEDAGVHRTPPDLIAAELPRYVVKLPQPDGHGWLIAGGESERRRLIPW